MNCENNKDIETKQCSQDKILDESSDIKHGNRTYQSEEDMIAEGVKIMRRVRERRSQASQG